MPGFTPKAVLLTVFTTEPVVSCETGYPSNSVSLPNSVPETNRLRGNADGINESEY